MLCQLKANVEKFAINDRKRSQLFGQAILIQIFVAVMLLAQIIAVITNEEEEYGIEAPSNFPLVLVKIPCIIALHFALTPQLDNALQIMKFSNQQSDLFHGYGAFLAYLVGLT